MKEAFTPYHYIKAVSGLCFKKSAILTDEITIDVANILLTKLKSLGLINSTSDGLNCRVSDSYSLTSLNSAINNLPANTPQEITAKHTLENKLSYLDAFLSQFTPQNQYNLILQQLTGFNETLVSALFPYIGNDWAADFYNKMTDTDSDGIPAGFAAFCRPVRQLALLFGKLSFGAISIDFISQNNAPVFGIANIAADNLLTLENIQTLVTYSDWVAIDPGSVVDVLHPMLLEDIQWANRPNTIAAFQQYFGIPADITDSVYSLTIGLSHMEAVGLFKSKALLCQQLGINGAQLLIFASSDYVELKQLSSILKASFDAQYENENELEKAYGPFEKKINELTSDILCDYLLARDTELNFKDVNELYAFFLLDPQMSGCMKISRVVAGHLSCQLYLHRVIMNLEQSEQSTFKAFLNPDAMKEWAWLKNYQVWRANRMVGVYPENYIVPDLRDDKSPEFKQLEEELLQEKITTEAAERAYKQYFKKFADLGKLVIAGTYYDDQSGENPVYHILGRTSTDPYEYYYRKHTPVTNEWTPWTKIDLPISAPDVSAYYYLGKLYIFWVDVVSKETSTLSNGSLGFSGYEDEIFVSYSYLNETNKWLQPQKMGPIANGNINGIEWIKWITFDGRDLNQPEDSYPWKNFNHNHYKNSKTFRKVYPYVENDALNLYYLKKARLWVEHNDTAPVNEYETMEGPFFLKVDLYNNKLADAVHATDRPNDINVLKINAGALKLDVGSTDQTRGLGKLDSNYAVLYATSARPVVSTGLGNYSNYTLSIVNNSKGKTNNRPVEYIFSLDRNYFLLTRFALSTAKRKMEKLNSSVIDELGVRLYEQQLEGFLSTASQQLGEKALTITANPAYLKLPVTPIAQLDFKGSTGVYFKELFFHIPFLIADHLNADGKYEDADWWYKRIFDPTAPDEAGLTNPRDRNWRYMEFRNQSFPKYSTDLTDPAFLEVYKNNPFNPFAIARLRTSAFQKSIVLKYVDNLLDWGDSLFRRFQFESINEAMMRYIMAQNILGARPVEAGKCETGSDEKMTYAQVHDSLNNGSDFLVWMENKQHYINNTNLARVNISSATVKYNAYSPALNYASRQVKNIYAGRTTSNKLLFCVPMNKDILSLWDRVEDRLFKIRNCMNIDGVKQTLSLFAPVIDPMMLVAAGASGMSIEEAIASLDAPIPNYRFSYMIEKAKGFAGTVQGFGSAMLSALEKKDGEALTLLRSVHEQNILKLMTETKKQQIEEAKANLSNLNETQKNIQNRVDYYTQLIADGLNGWERTQQIATHTVSIMNGVESTLDILSGTLSLIPDVGAPTSMKYGGTQLGNSLSRFAVAVAATAKASQALASSAGLEAGNQRRTQGWQNDLKLAGQELVAMERQIAAAQIRQIISEKDLQNHEKQIDQAKELDDFYKGKFTNIGLYKYMATTLNRLFSQAYSMAFDMAKKAEKCYQFETDNNIGFFVQNDNWDSGYAGLLAGERLSLQLQQLEKSFIENTPRRDEIRQSFSLNMLNPEALVTLQKTGVCEFVIPEWVFDLYYPGHYRRIIKSASITIPCIVGPYTNVPARLSLLSSGIRTMPVTGLDKIFGGPNCAHTSIAASSANNDGGQFELNFQDIRYLPFEGGGAVNSSWSLSLPDVYRTFDYSTISDVIINLNYSAKFDAQLKTAVNEDLGNWISDQTLFKVINLKQEFPDLLHRLLNSGINSTLELTDRIFPFFLKGKAITISKVSYAKVIDSDVSWVEIMPNPIIQMTLDLMGVPLFENNIILLIEYTLQ